METKKCSEKIIGGNQGRQAVVCFVSYLGPCANLFFRVKEKREKFKKSKSYQSLWDSTRSHKSKPDKQQTPFQVRFLH
jgi:hypothetical protein